MLLFGFLSQSATPTPPESQNEPHPFHIKSDWEPPVQPSVALGTLLEEVKLELASIEFDKPKDNISTGECQALKELSRNKSIILEKSDKGNITALMSRQDKLKEGQVLLNDLNNYQPLDKPVVETTTKKAQQPRDYKGDREGIPHIHPIP